MRDVEPNDLALFLTVAKHMSFRRAAADLARTPSAVSHAMRVLEEKLGVRLLNRTTRSVALTEAGARLLARVQPAFQDLDEALEDLNALRSSPVGTLRINAARASTQMVLLPLVCSFLAERPGMKVELMINNGLVDTVAEGFDAGVRFGERVAQDMIAVPIGGPQRSAVVASPSFFDRHPKPFSPEALRGLPCIQLRFGSGRLYDWEFDGPHGEQRVQVDGPLVCDDQPMMIDAALRGAGLAYVFEAQVAHHIASGALVRVLEEHCAPYPGFYLYYSSRRRVPVALRAFIDHVQQLRRTA